MEQGRSLARLVYLHQACGLNGNPINRVVPTYLAFGSDLASPKAEQDEAREVTRWRGRHDVADFQYQDVLLGGVWTALPFPPVRVLCVVGQGYGFYNGHHYSSYKTDGAAAEVVAFITGIANTLIGFEARRLALPFGYYLGGPTQAEAEPPPGSPAEEGRRFNEPCEGATALQRK